MENGIGRWVVGSTGRGRNLRFGLAVGLLVVVVGDHRALTAKPAGIDPFQLMDVQAKPNVLFLLDASAGMANTPDNSLTVGGDDIQSTFYQLKRATRTAIKNNAADINVGLAYFGPSSVDKTLIDSAAVPNGGPLVYVSTDATAASWPGFFTTASPVTVFPGACSATCSGGSCNNACSQEVFDSFNSTENGFTTTFSSRYYIKSRMFRSGVLFGWKPSGVNDGLTEIAAPITCPVPPAGLLGDDVLDTNDGTQNRPCFQIRNDEAGGAITTFYLASGVFGTGVTTCDGALGSNMASCVTDGSTGALDLLKLEMPLDPSTGTPTALPSPVPPATAATVAGTPAPNGIQTGGPNAIGESLQFALGYYNGTVNPARPAAADFAQRNFVVLVTGSRIPTCATDPIAKAYALFHNGAQAPFFPAYPGKDGIQTVVVAVPTSVAEATLADDIAMAGSGGLPDPGRPGHFTCDRAVLTADATATQNSNPETCHAAFVARTVADLDTEMKSALDRLLVFGEFSDQQSVTESIFEFAATIGVGNSPLDPKTRYINTIPLLLQSTYEVPGFLGHLKAFKNSGGTSVRAWVDSSGADSEAGLKLWTNVASTATGMGVAHWTFADLHGGKTTANIDGSTAKIKRRILTTTRNGVFVPNLATMAQDLVDRPGPTPVALPSGTNAYVGLVPLWPPTTNTGGVAPNDDSAGSLDGPLGLSSLTFSQLQTQFGACVGGSLPVACSSGTPSVALAKAVREAREMILAFTAGAEVVRDSLGSPVRCSASGVPVATCTAGQLLYQARSWILAESSLSAPAVMTPPPGSTPSTFATEWKTYSDGVRNGSGVSVDGTTKGFGLRNPDDDGTNSHLADLALKPQMSVIFHGANDMLHAFRAGPSCGNNPVTGCAEQGGEELWGFVPYDILPKLATRMQTQIRDPHTYMIAAPVRIADVFVPGSFSTTVGGVTVASANGVWRTVVLFGRGIGGKSVTALDVTSLGVFTKTALSTSLPIVLWSRGNPDTNDGTLAGTQNHDTNDYDAYLKMGQTWSVPAVGFVRTAENVSARKPTGMPFVAYMGSGYGTAGTREGKAFFALDPLTGDVLHALDIPDGDTTFIPDNAIVASPAAFNADLLQASSTANSASSFVTAVYVGDVQGRLWKFDASSLNSPILFADEGPSQPIGNAVALLNYNSDGTGLKPHVYVETGNDNRVDPAPAVTPPFVMKGYRDDGTGLGTELFGIQFPEDKGPLHFRGTVQPATTFSADDPTLGRVFFAGTQFNLADATNCVPSFDSIVFAVGAGTGGAAYDFGGPDPRAVQLAGQRIQAIRTSGGILVIDKSLEAQNAPRPPAPPSQVGSGPVQNQVFVKEMRGNTTVCR